ncbi:MAG: hypothetical protein LBS84_03065 [Clostridiales bacterium]|jgi:hypothetical protein|nr:hypothetical protein [Clostridiales bacterium]
MKVFTYISAVAAAALFMLSELIVGTYAGLVDFSQHKTSDITGHSDGLEVFLVESFDPPADWSEGEVVEKKIFVRNGGSEPAYVRLILKEYLEYVEYTYSLSDYRYLTDDSGTFITFTDADAAGAEYPEHTADEIRDAVSGVTAWHIRADETGGGYSRYLVTDIHVSDTAVKIDPSKEKASPEDYHVTPNLECEYTPRIWNEEYWYLNYQEDFHKYIEWNLGGGVISLTEWRESGSQPVSAWIYDDSANTSPYVFWGGPLAPGESTSNLLESVTLKESPEGAFYYVIHVDMEVVSEEGLFEWTSAEDYSGDASRLIFGSAVHPNDP